MRYIVPLIIVCAGAFGGTVSIALSAEPSLAKWRWSAISGIGAAALVPLFLQTVSSQLLEEIFRGGEAAKTSRDLVVFASFCVLAGISSRKFIETLSEKVLQEVREAKLTAIEASRGMERVAGEAGAAARAAIDAVTFGTVRSSVLDEDTVSIGDVQPGAVENDPWKGVFGGSPTSESRVLTARLTPFNGSEETMLIDLRVASSDPVKPLLGSVQFFLHPTFGQSKPVVPVRGGEATLSVSSYGAFTVGVLADEGRTRLELDLAKHPDARAPWKDR